MVLKKGGGYLDKVFIVEYFFLSGGGVTGIFVCYKDCFDPSQKPKCFP